MQLKDIAKEPKLIKHTLDAEEIVAEFGEAIEFYMYDRYPMNVFLKLASVDGDMMAMGEIVKEMILDDKGKPVVSGKVVLPLNIMTSLINKVVEELGKTGAQTTPT